MEERGLAELLRQGGEEERGQGAPPMSTVEEGGWPLVLILSDC